MLSFCSVPDSLALLDSYDLNILQIFIKLLRTILVDNATEWLATMPAIKDLLVTGLGIYQRRKFPNEIRTRILIMLCDIVLDHKLYNAYGQNIFSNWLPTLPKLLCQPFVSSHVLKTFSHLARQQNPIFMKHLEANQQAIIGKCLTERFDFVRLSTNWFFTFFRCFRQLIACSNQRFGKPNTRQTRYYQFILLA